MIRNYLKTAFRSLLKNKGFTFINVFGLALGLATCLLIVFYVFDELSYDRYNAKYERIYRVNSDLKYGGTLTSFAIAAPPVGDAMAREFPEVERSTRLALAINLRFKKGNEIIQEDRSIYCDPNIFDIFTLPMIAGDPKTALRDPNDIVISEKTAKKYFSSTDVVGKTLTKVGNDGNSIYKIAGVIRDIPAQSHFKADFLFGLDANQGKGWNGFMFNTYILLQPGADPNHLEAKFDGLLRRHIDTKDFNYTKFAAHGNYIKLSLTPLEDIHLQSNRQRELSANGNIQYVYIFSAIAIFILVLACINFMNLSTARSANRAREVGVRKVLGSTRRHLVAQFLAESLIVTLAAAIIAVVIALLLLPFFNQVSGKELSISRHTFTWLLPALLVIIVVVGILAGAYPAFFLSAFQPVHVLKGKLSAGFKGSKLRSFLVVFQFAISIFLIIGTLVVYNQLNYIQNKSLGFSRDQVLIVKNVTTLKDPKILKQEIKQIPGVVNATLTSFLPTGTLRFPNVFNASSGKNIQGEYWTVDEDYISTMGMKLVSGRNFSNQFATDSSAMIINETAARMLGYNGSPAERINTKYHIIGVVKDFNFSSLRDNVTPLFMVMAPDWMASLSIKVNTTDLPALMGRIESTWKQLSPNQHFEYSFMDEDFNALYSNEQRMGQLFIIFTTLAIIIACLGLFGLAAYAAEQRNREIGIRKVLGANVSTIVTMLSGDFMKLALISILISSPLAWLAMEKWLQSYAYREQIHWWVFAITALGALLIAFITISFQSIKAAMANPVESLKNE
ncbi:ABC transporter permease [Mucilaginibacter gotjawali]|uniref:ABC transport system permease protein n=1 Tax=Mucilaginibacter gotjawali TaxID=1550579 RepID=A0A839SIK0_9SPHI|nr:ABC transporter permease [Mucilaginibacter gotjawali]MBB3057123.1 putative ABC transport system permease protein [Mucilaginibacter gotjawali]